MLYFPWSTTSFTRNETSLHSLERLQKVYTSTDLCDVDVVVFSKKPRRKKKTKRLSIKMVRWQRDLYCKASLKRSLCLNWKAI